MDRLALKIINMSLGGETAYIDEDYVSLLREAVNFSVQWFEHIHQENLKKRIQLMLDQELPGLINICFREEETKKGTTWFEEYKKELKIAEQILGLGKNKSGTAFSFVWCKCMYDSPFITTRKRRRNAEILSKTRIGAKRKWANLRRS